MNPLGIVLVVVLVAAVFGHVIGPVAQAVCLIGWIYGMVLSFRANGWLGLAALILPPIGIGIGVGSFVIGRNLARLTMDRFDQAERN